MEVSREFVMLAGLQLGEQLTDGLLQLGEFLDERLAVHISCNITIRGCRTTLDKEKDEGNK
jgi:hypothetical protein